MGDSAEIKIGEVEIGGRRHEVSGSIWGTGIPTRPMTLDELKAAIGRKGILDPIHPLAQGLISFWVRSNDGGWIDVTGPTTLPEATPDEPDGTSEPAKAETWRDRPPLL
jgi:hypothetical protein